MALSRALIVLALAATIFSIIVMAKETIVGDEEGWTTWFDYQTWAGDKFFYVGGKLIFKYPIGKHNVVKVNATDFMNCKVSEGTQALTSGQDTIELATAGREWYISSLNNDCFDWQKLAIDVLPQTLAPSSPSHSPSPSILWHFVALSLAIYVS